MDAVKNFSYGVIATPPTPPTSGVTMILAAGQGSNMPAPPFNATVWPSGQQPLYFNSEIVRVTGLSGDSITSMVRAQEGTVARSIISGDQFASTITKSVIDHLMSPVGMIVAYGGTAAPTDWLMCDGTAVSRTTYAALFAVIGTAYGAGDGSTTFNVPDLRGRAPYGRAPGGKAAVDALGDNEGVTMTNRSPSHFHSLPDYQASITGPGGGAAVNSTGSQNTSGDANNYNMPAYLVTNFIIRTV